MPRFRCRLFFSGMILILLVILVCVSLGSGHPQKGGEVTQGFGSPKLYHEVPAIEVQGNEVLRVPPKGTPYLEIRSFNPQTPKTAEFGNNNFKSFSNAANRLLDIELAACVVKAGQNKKHLGYLDDLVWTEPWVQIPGTSKYMYQFPDTMPQKADKTGTDGTQFLQLIIPFEIDPASIFDNTKPLLDYLSPDSFTIEDESGVHIFCTVLVNGVDVNGNGPGLYTQDPEWPQLKGVNISPGPKKTSIVFIAQPSAGVLGDVPDQTPFSAWKYLNEIRIHLKKVKNMHGEDQGSDSKWYVLQNVHDNRWESPPFRVRLRDGNNKTPSKSLT